MPLPPWACPSSHWMPLPLWACISSDRHGLPLLLSPPSPPGLNPSPEEGTFPQTVLFSVSTPPTLGFSPSLKAPIPPFPTGSTHSCGLSREGFLERVALLMARPFTKAKVPVTRGCQETLSLSGVPGRALRCPMPVFPPQLCCLLEPVAWPRLLSGLCLLQLCVCVKMQGRAV